jgi:hypothetical protein
MLRMKELLRSNDLVYLSWVRAMLAEEDLGCVLLDEHASGVEGSIGAIPRRLMVDDDQLERAALVLKQAEAKLNGG